MSGCSRKTRMEKRVFLALVFAFCMTCPLEATLKVGFYKKSCPRAEQIVSEEIIKAFRNDNGIAANLVRMHFHDCFVRGCDGSILLDPTSSAVQAEKEAAPNFPSLDAKTFVLIDKIKAKLEKTCRGVVSCADILAFASRDSIRLSKGIFFDLPSGRRDGSVSLGNETFIDLPPPIFNLSQLIQSFARKGLNQSDLVTLSGAHSIGQSNCTSFSFRLYNFSATAQTDPTLDPVYAAQLKRLCPPGELNTNVPMDPPSPQVLDSSYYLGVLRNRGLFSSDAALLTSAATARQVRAFRNNNFLFNKKFAEAMIKMGNIEVLTGKKGEIRRKCRVVNKR